MSRSFSSLCAGLKAIGDAIAGVAFAIFSACCCRSSVQELGVATQSHATPPARYEPKEYEEAEASRTLSILFNTSWDKIRDKLVAVDALQAFRVNANAKDVDKLIDSIHIGEVILDDVDAVVLAGAIKKLFGSVDVKSPELSLFTQNYLGLAKAIVDLGKEQDTTVKCCRDYKSMAVLIAPTLFPKVYDHKIYEGDIKAAGAATESAEYITADWITNA